MAKDATKKREGGTVEIVADEASAEERFGEMLPLDECPTLAKALAGPDGARLGGELERLFHGRLKSRATRRQVKRITRLQWASYDEVVLLKDVSASGVRLSIRADQPLDLRHMLEMRLTVQLPGDRHIIPVALVRVIGKDGGNIDLACRFLTDDPTRNRLVKEIRSHIFG